ncbi:MAG: endonuclease MutS2 [Candidatus Omnitrophica bacterium]|nr:endonuclease MutS2 [Candidatus Omnitrophota bacterium]
MDQHALHVLEFEKVKEALNGFVSSALGKEAAADLHPLTNLYAIRENLSETTEMVRLYEAEQAPPLDGLYDVREPLQKSTLSGAMLEPADILMIGETAAAARRIRQSAKTRKLETPRIARYCERLAPFPEIEEAIGRVFDEQKNIRDSASPELARVRRAIRQQRTNIVRRLERLIRGSWRSFLQENYHTQRDGRYVLPVDARYQNKVPGIIHDRSATGTTVYIEPMELVEDSNYLKNLMREEEMEIRRILRELTSLIAERELDLQQNLTLFAHLDFISAKARFSIRGEMNEPKLREDRTLSIVNARHPLLLMKHGRDKVVPLNLTLSPEVRGLIVTGPNTGGKTVVLKTVGILVLMAQAGLHVPADSNTELPVFDAVGADIGDEQSLEQSLSTFSSHMNTIRRVLETADSKTLVLLDELGSGTDPVEGGALSCAILDQLHRLDASYIVTTHLQELKVYAYKTDGVENGAMEFDLMSLQPTYRFTMGLPGKSNAIQIAERLGLPAPVIEKAHASLERDAESPEELLARLGDELRKAQSLRAEADRGRQKANRLQDESERRLANARREAREVIKRSERKAQNLLHELERRIKQLEKKEAEFKREWEAKLAALIDKQPSTSAASSKSILEEARAALQSSQKAFEKAKPAIEKKYERRRNWKWRQLKPGVLVQLEGISEPGKVLRVQPEKQQVEVAVSSMNLRLNGERILAILKHKPNPVDRLFTNVKVDRPETIEHKVDVHGMTVEEMTPIVEKYIDKAFLAGLKTVTIVHGHGMGVLRQAVRRLLQNNPIVKHINPGMDFEGGTGVTVVQLKSSR